AQPSLFVNASWSPGRKAMWLHLLNVSAFYRGGDTGFRGMGKGPAGPRVASDAELAMGGKVQRISRPEKGVIAVNRRLKVRSARLAVSGARLKLDGQGRISFPEIDVHDVLVLEMG
ncbi:MAG: hypothetical protein ACREUU_15915, partial [Gammaproteobacteria bacterium]